MGINSKLQAPKDHSTKPKTSQMTEAFGEPGRIQVTENTYELLKREYELEERGKVGIKRKGMTKTYFLKGPRQNDHLFVKISIVFFSQHQSEFH